MFFPLLKVLNPLKLRDISGRVSQIGFLYAVNEAFLNGFAGPKCVTRLIQMVYFIRRSGAFSGPFAIFGLMYLISCF